MRGGARVTIESRPIDPGAQAPVTTLVQVQEGYFEALGVPLVRGRAFNTLDLAGALPVVIVNRAFEQRHLAGRDAIGQRITIRTSPTDSTWLTIVGVVPDLHASGLERAEQDAVYRPLAQAMSNSIILLAGTPGNPAALLPAIREVVAALDPELPLENSGSVSHIIRRENWFYGVFGTLFAAFGLGALFVATVGLYGVMAFSVNQRRREMGVRKAVGATARDIVRMVLRQGMRHACLCSGCRRSQPSCSSFGSADQISVRRR